MLLISFSPRRAAWTLCCGPRFKPLWAVHMCITFQRRMDNRPCHHGQPGDGSKVAPAPLYVARGQLRTRPQACPQCQDRLPTRLKASGYTHIHKPRLQASKPVSLFLFIGECCESGREAAVKRLGFLLTVKVVPGGILPDLHDRAGRVPLGPMVYDADQFSAWGDWLVFCEGI